MGTDKGAFGTTTRSTLKWFSAKSDMSATNGASTPLYPAVEQGVNSSELEGVPGGYEVDLSRLFKITPLIGSLEGTSSADGSVESYLSDVSPQFTGNSQNEMGWGQTYGWYCDSPDSDLYPRESNSPALSRQSGDMIFGAPFSIGGNSDVISYGISTSYACRS